MKLFHCLCFLLFLKAGYAQNLNYTYKYDTLYYHYSKGVQMIEIRQHDQSNYYPNMFSYASDFWSIKENLPIYIWRDESGKILKTENVFAKEFRTSDFLPPAKVKKRSQYHNMYARIHQSELTSNPKYCLAKYRVYKLEKQTDNKYKASVGLVDSMGVEFLPKEFTSIHFSDSVFFAAVQGGYLLFDFWGRPLSTELYAYAAMVNQYRNQILVQKNGKFGLMDIKGQMLLPIEYDEIILSTTIPNNYFIKKGKLYGMMNAVSLFQTAPFSPTYTLSLLKPGYFTYRKGKDVYLLDSLGRNMLTSTRVIQHVLNENRFIVGGYKEFFLVDAENKSLIKSPYTSLFPLKEGMLIAGSGWKKDENTSIEKSEYFEIIDYEGKNILSEKFLLIRKLNDECLLVARDNGWKEDRWELIDYAGKNLVNERFEDCGNVVDNIFYLRKESGFKLIQIKQNKVIAESKKVKSFQLLHHDLFAVWNGELWALMNKKFELLSPFSIQEVQRFKGDAGAVKIRGKYVIFNSEGQLIVDSDFDRCEILENNLVFVRKDGLNGILNAKGQFVVPMIYQELKVVYDKSSGFRFGVKLNGKWGVINLENEKLIPFDYDSFAEISIHAAIEQKRIDGYYAFMVKGGRRKQAYCYFNVDPSKNQIVMQENPSFGFEKTTCHGFGKDLQGVKNWDGQQVIACKYDYIGDFRHCTFRFAENGKVGLLDTTGRIVVPALMPLMYDVVGDDKLIQVGRHYGNWGLWTYSGKMIADTLYGGFDKPIGGLIPFNASFNHRLEEGQMVHDGKKVGFMNFEGKIIINAEYDSYYIDNEDELDSGYFIIKMKKDGKWIAFDSKGRRQRDKDQ